MTRSASVRGQNQNDQLGKQATESRQLDGQRRLLAGPTSQWAPPSGMVTFYDDLRITDVRYRTTGNCILGSQFS